MRVPKEKIIAAVSTVAFGMSRRDAAMIFDVNLNSIRRWLHLFVLMQKPVQPGALPFVVFNLDMKPCVEERLERAGLDSAKVLTTFADCLAEPVPEFAAIREHGWEERRQEGRLNSVLSKLTKPYALPFRVKRGSQGVRLVS